MKNFLISLSSTVLIFLSMTPLAASAITEGSKRTDSCLIERRCKDSYSDPSGTKKSDVEQDGGYRAVQWIGTAFACENTSTCAPNMKKESTGTVTWQFGVNLEVTAGIKDVAAYKAAATASRTVTQSDRDTIDIGTVKLKRGQSVVPYTYVYRQPYALIYSGVWLREKDSYRCGIRHCFDYYWRQDSLVMSMAYNKALEDFQTLTYKIYTTSQGSGLKKE